MTNDQIDRMIAHHEKQIAEVWALFRETREQFSEQSRETREQFKEAQERQKKIDEQIAETNKTIAELGEQVKETTKAVGDISNKWGEFIENIVAPGIMKVFAAKKIELSRLYQDIKAYLAGAEMEIDILAVNTEYALVVSIKSTLEQADVDDLLTDLERFKRFFPEYSGKKVLGAVAGIVMPQQITRYAYKRGIFVLGQSGDTIAILNDKKFKPREW